MPQESRSLDDKEIFDDTIREIVKDLVVKKPFKRGERLDGVSAAILNIAGVILVLYVGLALKVLEDNVLFPVQVLVLSTCIILVASMISLASSIRSREIMSPNEITIESYMGFLGELSRVNDYKKKLQDLGLVFLVLGIVLMVALLVVTRIFILL